MNVSGSFFEQNGSSSSFPRVLHVAPSFFHPKLGTLGGAERYTLELARAMAEVVPTALLTFGRQPLRTKVGNLEIEVRKARWQVGGNPFNPLDPLCLLRLFEPDVVHFHQKHILMTSVGALVGRALGKRVFVTDLGGGGWDVSAYLSTDGLFHQELYLSKYAKGLSRSARQGTVIFGGVDTVRFQPEASVSKETDVLFVGRILPHKGIDILIEALPEGANLDVVGQPYDSAYYEELKQLARGKPVRFLTEVDDGDLVRAYQRAKIIVLPSVYRDRYGGSTAVPELLGQTLLEGMACGLPAVATQVGSLPELVEDGYNGFLVPPNEVTVLSAQMKWLLAHPGEAAAMGQRARQRTLERFSWQKTVQRCLSAYEKTKSPV